MDWEWAVVVRWVAVTIFAAGIYHRVIGGL